MDWIGDSAVAKLVNAAMNRAMRVVRTVHCAERRPRDDRDALRIPPAAVLRKVRSTPLRGLMGRGIVMESKAAS